MKVIVYLMLRISFVLSKDRLLEGENSIGDKKPSVGN